MDLASGKLKKSKPDINKTQHMGHKQESNRFYFQLYQAQATQQRLEAEMSEQLAKQITTIYQPVQLIGSGAYGHVWKVIDRKTKTYHALKKSFDAFQNSTDAQRTYRQVMFLQQLKHPNIIKLQQIIRAQNDKDIYLVFELMDIDLYSLIRENLLTERHRRYIAYQVALSIQYMHTVGLVHRDIKPSNVLVNEDCLSKICDFGLVRGMHQIDQMDSDTILTEYIATRWYRAPQLLLGSKKYDKSVDIWSLGCLIGEMLRSKPLFPGNSTLNQLERVLSWTGPPTLQDLQSLKTNFGKEMLQLLNKIKPVSKKEFIPNKNYSEEGVELISQCLQFNPDKRPTIDSIVKHPYFKEFFREDHLFLGKEKENGSKLLVWDQSKLTIKEYRRLIYNQIKVKPTKQKQKSVQMKNKSEVCTPSPVVSMQATGTEPKRSMKTQYGTYHRGSSNNSETQGHVYTNKAEPFNKPRTVSGKKKYGSLLAKSPQISRKKYVKTEEKVEATEEKLMQRKKSNSNGVKFFCENSGTVSKNGISTTGVATGTSYKNSLEKRQGKKISEGLARFFYRRGKLH